MKTRTMPILFPTGTYCFANSRCSTSGSLNHCPLTLQQPSVVFVLPITTLGLMRLIKCEKTAFCLLGFMCKNVSLLALLGLAYFSLKEGLAKGWQVIFSIIKRVACKHVGLWEQAACVPALSCGLGQVTSPLHEFLSYKSSVCICEG